MKHFHWRIGAAALVAGGFAGQVVGCVFKPELISLGDGTAACIPSEHPDAPVDASCGVFVSAASGDDTQAGTPDQPVKTLKQAIALTQGKTNRVYACADKFDEAVEVPAGISLFGGLYCASTSPVGRWKYIGDQAQTELTANAEQIPLVLLGGNGTTRIEDFEVRAQPAVNPGGSSIAAVVDEATAALVRCTFEAGDGRDGAAGELFMGAAKDGVQGNNGVDACSAMYVSGADSVSSLCGDPDSSSGHGGDSFEDGSTAGSNGSPGMTMNGGSGETDVALCTPGQAGSTGLTGTPGGGAVGLGTISKSGYAGVAGSVGTAGYPGQGGGGGGGARGRVDKCSSATPGGASGGSGGSGGCGGAGGKGGGAGGASIALISAKATLTLTKVILRTGNGGKGGDGGLGQDGGSGAPGGSGGLKKAGTDLNSACDGGPGGAGGKGGQGGGGRGGHAIGLAYVGQSAPAVEGVLFGMKGLPGSGGKGTDLNHDGAPGLQADVQSFP